MGHKAVETICNINNASGSGTANDVPRSGGSRSFAKEPRATMIRSAVAGRRKVKMTN